MKRRYFLKALVVGLVSPFFLKGSAMALGIKGKDKKEDFPFRLTDAEWKQRLTAEQYRVLRKEGTERAHSSPLNKEKRNGLYNCTGCEHPLYSSDHKYDSGTGWPSFWQPVNEKAIGTSTDFKLIYSRTEVHCANCGGHLGHVFEDGPQPTGLRYCMNGVALTFAAAAE